MVRAPAFSDISQNTFYQAIGACAKKRDYTVHLDRWQYGMRNLPDTLSHDQQ